MYLGLDHQTGQAYEGLGNAEFPISPNPNVSQACLIESPDDWSKLQSGIWYSATVWVFREDSFDAVTRTRRGRLYEPHPGKSRPSLERVEPHLFENPLNRSAGPDGRIPKTLHVYSACNALLLKPHQGLGLTLALGSNRASSAWRIIQTEVLASGCVMVTLKSLTAYGLIPALDDRKIDPEFKTSVLQATTRVLESAFRETPISVIDHCRNALTVVISRWLVQNGHDRSVLSEDLAKVATAVLKPPYEKGCVSQLAHVVARLHVRGKANEQHARGLRLPVEEDAEIAIEILGFVFRELDWALN